MQHASRNVGGHIPFLYVLKTYVLQYLSIGLFINSLYLILENYCDV